MPNIKSAIKRVNVIEKKTLRNSMIKSDYKTAIRKFEESLEAGKKADSEKLIIEAIKKIDSACSKGILKKNTASRKKSNLAKKLNTITIKKIASKTTKKTASKTTKKAASKTAAEE